MRAFITADGNLEMKTIYKRLIRVAASAGLLGAILGASGSVMAASYNIILKNASGTPVACAVGGFSFNKGSAGSSPVSATVDVTGCTSSAVPPPARGVFQPGALNVVVENVTLNKPGTNGQNEPLNQGPNVEGLAGTLQFVSTLPGACNGRGTTTVQKTYTISFAYGGGQNAAGRTYTVDCVGPGTFSSSGTYHVLNVATPVPEPETLLLIAGGLAALAFSRRRQRRS